jgi:hypothetical protein
MAGRGTGGLSAPAAVMPQGLQGRRQDHGRGVGANHTGAVMSHGERKSKYTKLHSVVQACTRVLLPLADPSKQSLTTMERSLPLTSRSQPCWGRYPILPNPITRGSAASTNTPTACSDSTSQKVNISLLCQIPMSKGSVINSTPAPERYSAIELLVWFSSTPKICSLHFAVEMGHIKKRSGA